MNPEENPRECEVCREAEPSFTHTVTKTGVIRRLCTDCLLKEHRDFFCHVCFNVFDDAAPPPSQARVICLNCPSSIHLSCSRQPPSSSAASSSSSAPPPASSFTCALCSDPNFTFFPKSRVNDDVPQTPLTLVWSMALVAAAKISVAIMNNAVARLKDDALKKIIAAQTAKLKAKAALEHLHDLVIRQKAAQTQSLTPGKRKSDER